MVCGVYGMVIASGLPYAPHMYEYQASTVTISLDTQILVPSDTRRVGLYFDWQNPIVAVAPYLSVDGNGVTSPKFQFTTNGILQFYWYRHYNLVQREWYANDYGVGTVFTITEVIFNQLTEKEVYNATRKPESLASKIKRFALFSK